MSLKDQITEDMKTAMRAKDSARLGTIRLLLAAVKQKEVDERVVVDDVMMVAIVDKLIKQRKDSITAFTQADRMDLADKETAEVKVLISSISSSLNIVIHEVVYVDLTCCLSCWHEASNVCIACALDQFSCHRMTRLG